MNNPKIMTMRDVLIEQIYQRMKEDDTIFFVSADLGAPALDKLRRDFKDRFVNVGIAEQNLVNVATGLALEGFTVFAYAIACFLSMRAYEQIRINLALSSQHKRINVNLIGVGSGVSYDMSGPSHHCLEDLAIIRTLPNITLFSPSDNVMTEKFTDYSIATKSPKYIRLDGKPLPRIYEEYTEFEWEKGFYELEEGDDICIVSTGYMTHKALKISKKLNKKKRLGVVDIFLLKPIDEKSLFVKLQKYKYIITLEEGFVGKGGLDSLVSNILRDYGDDIKLGSMGFNDRYLFEYGSRESLYKYDCLDEDNIEKKIMEISSR